MNLNVIKLLNSVRNSLGWSCVASAAGVVALGLSADPTHAQSQPKQSPPNQTQKQPIPTKRSESSSVKEAESAESGPIEIIGLDGKPAKISPRFSSPAGAGKGNRPAKTVKKQQPGGGLGIGANIHGFGFDRDGSITITGPDGKPVQIETDGAQSIIINRSVQSLNKNGKEEVQSSGKAIIVDSNGQRHEIDLSGQNPLGVSPQPPGKPAPKSYMIGVSSRPVSAALRSHLNLGEGTGIIVDDVIPNSPASEAGLQKHDVILYVDDTPVGSTTELSGLVQDAGKREATMSLTVARGGQEVALELKPVERQIQSGLLRQMPGGVLELRDLGPGVMFDDAFNDRAFDEMRQRMRDHMKQVREQMQELHRLMEKDALDGIGVPLPRKLNPQR